MKILDLFIRVTLLLSIVNLVACGGGGGNGGDGNSYSLSLDKTTVTLTADSTSQPVVATFRGDGVVVGTLPGATLPSWLSVNAPTTAASPVTVTISAFPQLLQPGRYSTTLRFATGKADGTNIVSQDVNVTYTVDHVLSPSSLIFSSAKGATNPAASLNLTTAGATWTASTNQPWLTVSPASGTGSAILTVSTNTSSLPVGGYQGAITVRDTLTNRTRTTAVDLAMSERRLEARPRGVALTSTQGSSVLTRTIQVADTANLNGHWKATADANWLLLSPSSGVGGGPLTLTANDASLADGMYYATVTIMSDADPALTNTTQVKVGFYVDHHSPVPPISIVTGNILGAGDIVADPIRPFAYAARTIFDDATSSFNGVVDVYNFYTGQLLETLSFPGRMMTGLAISPDGGMLIAADTSNTANTADRYLIPITLNGSTRVVGSRWSGVKLGGQFSYFKIIEISGAPVILTGEKQIVSIANGAVLGTFQTNATGAFLFTGKLAVSSDGSTAFLFGTSGGNHRLARYRLTNLNGAFQALETHNINETGSGYDIATDASGTRFITLSDDSFSGLREYDGSTVTVTVTKSVPANFSIQGGLDVAVNGDVYITGFLGTFVRYDTNFVQRGMHNFNSSIYHTFYGRVSGDGQRAVVVTSGTSGVADVHLNFLSSSLQP